MKKLSDISRSFIAMLLALAVINIYVTDSYCSFTKGEKHHPSLALTEQSESHHSHEAEATEHHHHDNVEAEEHHHDANQPEDENHHDGKNENNCCKDETSEFFSSLIHPTLHSVLIKTPVNSLGYLVNSFNRLLSFETFSSPLEYLLFKPPPNISDIRVFIQSFII